MAGLAGESDRFIGALTKSIVIGHYPSAKCSDMTRQVFAFAKFGKERCAYVGQIYHVLQKPERAANLTEADSLWIPAGDLRSEEHTSELQSLMRISYAVFCLKKKKQQRRENISPTN